LNAPGPSGAGSLEVADVTATGLDDLPTVVDLPTAAEMLGIGRTLAYQLVRAGQWPTPVIRIGRLIKVPTQPLMVLLKGAA
jgi:hypothetical protein